jgi:hypothetical protein
MSSKFAPQDLRGWNHPIIEGLYDADIVLDPKFLDQILALPPATLIEDLEWMINDELGDLKFMGEGSDFEDNFTLFHALMLLGHLRSEKSLSLILKVWKFDEELLEMLLGDLLFEELWQVPLLCGEHQLDQLEALVPDSTVPDVFCRVEMVQIMERIAKKDPHRKEEIIAILGKLLLEFSEIPDAQFSFDETIVVSYLVSGLADLNAIEFSPLIESMYQRDRVDVQLRGDWEDVKSEFGEIIDPLPPIYSDVRDWYRIEGAKWASVFKEHKEQSKLHAQKLLEEKAKKLREIAQQQKPVNKKIGRNDPCPCGSGKKYKKCHGMK